MIKISDIQGMTPAEQRQAKACFNEYLGRQYAAQQRRRKIARAIAEENNYEEQEISE